MTTSNEKICFVIAPIGSEGSETRKRSDAVLKHIFREALHPRGYKLIRADEISQPGSITVQVIEKVLNADLVIADLTDHNPNVFYELAVRHAAQKPLLHVIQAGQSIPFDVSDFRTIPIELDLDGAAKARAAINAQVEEIEKGLIAVTPITLAGILLELGKSSDSRDTEEKLILRQVIEGLGEIRSELRTGFDSNHARTMKMLETMRIQVQGLERQFANSQLRTQDALQGEASKQQGTSESVPAVGEQFMQFRAIYEGELARLVKETGKPEAEVQMEAIKNAVAITNKNKKDKPKNEAS